MTINVNSGGSDVKSQMQFVESRVDQLSDLVQKISQVLYQSKGQFFNKMLE